MSEYSLYRRCQFVRNESFTDVNFQRCANVIKLRRSNIVATQCQHCDNISKLQCCKVSLNIFSTLHIRHLSKFFGTFRKSVFYRQQILQCVKTFENQSYASLAQKQCELIYIQTIFTIYSTNLFSLGGLFRSSF